MASATSFCGARVLFLAACLLPVHADIISDITAPETDQERALQIKAEMFWKPILSAAEDTNMEKHLELYSEAETVIQNLPAQNEYVRKTLRESLDLLKRADDAVFQQALASARLAKQKLEAPGDASGSSFSFFTGGQNFLKAALRRFIGGGQYPERLVEQVQQRQADILPSLRGAAGSTSDILGDSRLASKKAFDVLQYDIYNRGVPKTPKAADDLANKIVEAAGETRRHFMGSITGLVKGITRDTEEKNEDPSVTVTKASLHNLHETIAKAETRFSRTSKKPSVVSSETSVESPLIIGDNFGSVADYHAEKLEYPSICDGCDGVKAESSLEQLLDA